MARRCRSAIAVDLPLARTQRLAELRTERNQRLDASDKARLQAMDDNDGPRIAQLRLYRQALRDLPATAQTQLDTVTTDDALDAWSPTWPLAP